MSIKSQKNNLDLSNMTIAKQRGPNYVMNKPYVKPECGQIDGMSDYVEKNIADNVQKRYGEHR